MTEGILSLLWSAIAGVVSAGRVVELALSFGQWDFKTKNCAQLPRSQAGAPQHHACADTRLGEIGLAIGGAGAHGGKVFAVRSKR